MKTSEKLHARVNVTARWKPIVNVKARIPPHPLATLHGTELSETHSVESVLVPPTRPRPLDPCSPKADPSSVTLNAAVDAPLTPKGVLTLGSSKDNPPNAVPALMLMVTVIVLDCPMPKDDLAITEESESQSVASAPVNPALAPAVCKKEDPPKVKLTDPLVGALRE
mmetsp:Transcript_11716/g.26819  ORF Transcript_11716/g.26819 Transcript_11716/m.26819 type:complete len:167 (-) Transcript_11716:468-968(-)